MIQAIKLCKEECIGTFASCFLDYIINPGVMFSIRAERTFSERAWNNNVNLITSVFDSTGKALG
jgi:hypothetical protein